MARKVCGVTNDGRKDASNTLENVVRENMAMSSENASAAIGVANALRCMDPRLLKT
jgi:hypothetical protein